jgi:hypothetical protein
MSLYYFAQSLNKDSNFEELNVCRTKTLGNPNEIKGN